MHSLHVTQYGPESHNIVFDRKLYNILYFEMAYVYTVRNTHNDKLRVGSQKLREAFMADTKIPIDTKAFKEAVRLQGIETKKNKVANMFVGLTLC